jgi:hypothetical protein
MSRHQEWKMIHLLYRYGRRSGRSARRVLTEQELTSAGVHCDPDSRQVLEDAGVVRRVGNAYELCEAARKIVGTFTVAKGPEQNVDIRVDYPEVFVVMPFSQPWSDEVHERLFAPAIEAAGFAVARGDAIVRVGDLGTNVWRSITQAGVIVAEVSLPNPNVYYELGLADALGKPVFLFKQADAALPADISGVHYYEYHLSDLVAGREQLTRALRDWAGQKDHQFFGVKALADR